MLYNIVTFICLSLIIFHVVYVTIGLSKKDRYSRITALRGFKTVQALIIYIAIIPLYYIGYIYNGDNAFFSFFYSIKSSINLIVLDYSIDSIVLLLKDNLFYYITMCTSFVLVTVNVFLFTLSMISQHLWTFINKLIFRFSKRETLLIFGFNDKSIKIYKSESKRRKFFIDDITREQADKCYLEGYSFINTNNSELIIDNILKSIKKTNRKFYLIINTSSDENNILLSKIITNKLKDLSINEQDLVFKQLNVYVFGNPQYQSVYDTIVLNGHGAIHYINKYQRFAIDFIDKHPIAKYMDERHIDYDTSTVKENVNINFLFFGFGKTSQQMFLTSIANNQFITFDTNNKLQLKKVNYHIFDKYESENNKMLNHDYYRFRDECLLNRDANFLPFPSIPANEYYYHLNINSCDFYNRIRNIISGENNVNFIMIAYGTDLENVDLARKIIEKKHEWDIKDLIVFVKARQITKEESFIDDDFCHFVANEEDIVYNIDNIVADDITKMSKLRNEIYSLEYDITNYGVVPTEKIVNENTIKANIDWYVSKSQLERESNLYCTLSLRSKLLLMGLDYRKKTGINALSEDDYILHYAKNDLPDYSTYKLLVKNKKIINYPLDYNKNSRRTYMAELEHFRWNSFMISKGMIPSSINQILTEKIVKKGKEVYSNGKNYYDRRHGNLTTFDGLVEFRKILASRDDLDEKVYDVIKYDYQILDDAYWLLDSCGFEIFKK